jgi:acylphosphatase
VGDGNESRGEGRPDARRVTVRVSGYVQGVGFRMFTRRVARELGVAGYVRNLPDGDVEAVAEGDVGALQELITRLERGPAGSRVLDVRIEWDRPTGEFTSFGVRYA